ncbi:MAG TPA: hypothetical protein VG735_09400 [Caulobacterales bacterium]|nr:hypothetical protein [Caulobacterales bacterium]
MKNRNQANRFYAIATAAVLVGVLALSITVWLFRPAQLDTATLCPRRGQSPGTRLSFSIAATSGIRRWAIR